MNLMGHLRDLAEEAANPTESEGDPVIVAQARADFIKHADGLATEVLGAAATGPFVWEYDDDAPDDIERAVVRLGDRTRVEYQYDHGEEKSAFRLRRDCVCCGASTLVDITGLASLAGHLDDECWQEGDR